MSRLQKFLVVWAAAVAFSVGLSTGKLIYDRPHCHPTKPPAAMKLECSVEEGDTVSRLTCTNKSINGFFDCVDELEAWATTTFEGCR